LPRGLMKRTLLPRPVIPMRIGKWPGSFNAVLHASTPCDKEQPGRAPGATRADPLRKPNLSYAEIRDLAQRRLAVAAYTARRRKRPRFSLMRPFTFSLGVLAAWLRSRAERREMLKATSQLCAASDQVLEDIGVSRDEMLAKSMCRWRDASAIHEPGIDRQ
jgi:hypothetical protein